MQTASFSAAPDVIFPQCWSPPAWHTVVLVTDPEDAIWGAGGLIGMQNRRGSDVTVFSIVAPDKRGQFDDAELERRVDLRQALCHLEFGVTTDIIPLNLPNQPRLQQQVALLAELWPRITTHTLLVAPRLNAMVHQAARLICSTAAEHLEIALATYPPAHVLPYDGRADTDEVRLMMDAELWEAKRDALRCFATDAHPVVDGPFDLHDTGRFARLHEEFSLAHKP